MSEPVTNAKIEDVLSSIRRLVSDDGRSDMTREPAVQAPVQARGDAADAASDRADRLVLTPALRVHQGAGGAEADTVAEAEPAPQPSDMSAPWVDPSATLFSAKRDGEGAMTRPQDEDAAEDFSVGNTVEMAAEPSSGLPEVDAEEAAEPEEVLTFHSARAESLSAKIEALEAVIGRTRDQWEPDGTTSESYSGTPVRPIGWRDPAEEAAASEQPLEVAAEAPEETVEDLTPEAFDIEDQLTEDLVAEDVAPEDFDAEDVSDEAFAADDLAAADEAVIDEDSLRELVAEIVRQELQGALGERITRNVRKLVRREIHRALAAQDLE